VIGGEGTIILRRLTGFAIVGAAAIAGGVACRPAAAEPPAATYLKRFADIALARDSEVLAALIPPQSTLAAVLESHELLAPEVIAIVEGIGDLGIGTRSNSKPERSRSRARTRAPGHRESDRADMADPRAAGVGRPMPTAGLSCAAEDRSGSSDHRRRHARNSFAGRSAGARG
jgi:hypothetical protein